MQRTVKSVVITYASTDLVNDEIVVTKKTHTVFNETDTKKAVKKAVKTIGMFNPLKIEITDDLYVLDDDIFFKYAVKVEKTQKDEN